VISNVKLKTENRKQSYRAARGRHDFGVHGTPYGHSLELFRNRKQKGIQLKKPKT
jgi:hypothetical protein